MELKIEFFAFSVSSLKIFWPFFDFLLSKICSKSVEFLKNIEFLPKNAKKLSSFEFFVG